MTFIQSGNNLIQSSQTALFIAQPWTKTHVTEAGFMAEPYYPQTP
jgi:hypothetical protein